MSMDAPVVVGEGSENLLSSGDQGDCSLAQHHRAGKSAPDSERLYPHRRGWDRPSTANLYAVVAEILAFVFRAQAQAQE